MSVVAIVPAKDRADSVAATVESLQSVDAVDRVVVVDDGSTDGTADLAAAAGATVWRLAANRGKGGAVAHAVAFAPDAEVFLLVDADLGDTAGLAGALLDPVLAGDADMSIAVLPSAGRKGGFGSVRRFAAAGIHRATGFAPRAPLSGQRAVKAELLRSLDLADRFGLETALTIDALRAGARVVEVDVAMDHRHTGRRVAGFRHRAGQGVDIARALWPRLIAPRARSGLLIALTLVVVAAILWSGQQWQPDSAPLGQPAERVVVFGVPHLTFDDIEAGHAPTVRRLAGEGALASMSVRTASGRPTAAEAYASIGAGVRLDTHPFAAQALDAGERLPSGTASDVAARLQGSHVEGAVVVLGAPRVARENERLHLASEPGALGDALEEAGHAAAVVGNADVPDPLEPGTETIARPAALAVMDRAGGVDRGRVGHDLLLTDPTAPFGVRADPARVTEETLDALAEASVVVVDPGDTSRAAAMVPYASDPGASRAMRDAIVRTDAILSSLEARLPPRTLLLVLAVTPRSRTWALAPAIVAGDGVPQGRVVSPSTKRAGVVTITDVAPTILTALGANVPSEMAGQAWRYQAGGGELSSFQRLHDETEFRDSIYRPATTAYVVVEVILHIFAIFALSRRGGPGRYGPALRFLLLSAAAFPLATFIYRALPGSYELGGASLFALAALSAIVAGAVRNLRRHPLQPLTTIMGITIAVLVADVATGSRLHVSSILGYSLQSAGRFYGFPNTTFAVLAACTLLVVATHVHYARDRSAALLRGGLLLAVVVVADVAPGVGDDVGGVLALVPVGAVAFLAMGFGRVSLRRLAIASAATVAVLAVVTIADLLRPEDQQAHLGRFYTSLVDGGDEVFFETVRRKEAANFRILSNSVWTWVIPAAASLMLYLLVWERRFVSIVPSGSALRIGVVATVVASLLGFAVNDSGPVITALFFVFLGPFLVILALDHESDGVDELHDPRRTVGPVRMVGSS